MAGLAVGDVVSEFHYNLTRITGSVQEHQCTFMIISREIHFRMRNVSDKICKENKTHISCS